MEKKQKIELSPMAWAFGICVAGLIVAPVIWVFWGVAVFLTAPIPDPSWGASYYAAVILIVTTSVIRHLRAWCFPKNRAPEEEEN